MTPQAWTFLALAVLLAFLLVVALGTVDEQRAEINRLRGRIHPATRKALR